jgi:hypothetical protein
MSKLESFLITIDPNRSIGETQNRAADAFNTFGQKNSFINDHGEFRDLIGRFLWHVDSYILGIGQSSNPNLSHTRGMALNILDDIYGGNGESVAYEMASSGVEGGLYQVLKDITAQRVQY